MLIMTTNFGSPVRLPIVRSIQVFLISTKQWNRNNNTSIIFVVMILSGCWFSYVCNALNFGGVVPTPSSLFSSSRSKLLHQPYKNNKNRSNWNRNGKRTGCDLFRIRHTFRIAATTVQSHASMNSDAPNDELNNNDDSDNMCSFSDERLWDILIDLEQQLQQPQQQNNNNDRTTIAAKNNRLLQEAYKIFHEYRECEAFQRIHELEKYQRNLDCGGTRSNANILLNPTPISDFVPTSSSNHNNKMENQLQQQRQMQPQQQPENIVVQYLDNPSDNILLIQIMNDLLVNNNSNNTVLDDNSDSSTQIPIALSPPTETSLEEIILKLAAFLGQRTGKYFGGKDPENWLD